MKNLVILLFLLILFASCRNLKYEKDLGFVSSSQGNSFEHPLFVNNKPCADLRRKLGLCVIQITPNEPIDIYLDPKDYSYRLDFKCSADIQRNETFDVPKKKPFSLKLTNEDYKELKAFMCIGEIFPFKREGISSKFLIYVRARKAYYIPRTSIHFVAKENSFVLGSHALFINANKKLMKRKTYIDSDVPLKIYTESYMGRFNYYGF